MHLSLKLYYERSQNKRMKERNKSENNVETVDELLELLMRKKEGFFRGYQKEEELISSLGRCGDKKFDEFHMFQEFALEVTAQMKQTYCFMDMISLAQHYGIPTNLVDLTTDPFVALFFGMGKEKCGKFNVLYVEKEQFEKEYASSLEEKKYSLGDMGCYEYSLGDMKGLLCAQTMEIGPKTPLTDGYLKSPYFLNGYNDFFTVQASFAYVPYTENGILRQKQQSGLFLMASNKCKPIPKEWFSVYSVNLSEVEVHKLRDELFQKGYTAEVLLPETDISKEVDIKAIVDRIRKKYGVDYSHK